MLRVLPGVLTYPLCFCLGIALILLGAQLLHRAYDAVFARRRQPVSVR